jgi:hypothetical protein
MAAFGRSKTTSALLAKANRETLFQFAAWIYSGSAQPLEGVRTKKLWPVESPTPATDVG